MPHTTDCQSPPKPPRKREREGLTRNGSRLVTARLTAPDRERLTRALDARGLPVSVYLRRLILRDLDSRETDVT